MLDKLTQNMIANAAAFFNAIKQGATSSATGVVELATDAETITGTDTTRAITPANLKARLNAAKAASELAGTDTNDAAVAGRIGEFIESSVLSGSAVALTTAVAANVTSISLTAGDWDVSASVVYVTGASTSITSLTQSISLTSATLDLSPGRFARNNMAAVVPGASSVAEAITVPVTRISLAATTTCFLVATAVFTVSTLSAYGQIRARRVR